MDKYVNKSMDNLIDLEPLDAPIKNNSGDKHN